jgi:quinol monooxygenase YgiN
MFVVRVKAQVKPDKIELYEANWRELRAKVLAHEPGVLFYELCRDPLEPNAYQVFECYKDRSVQDVHLTTHYYLAASAVAGDCLVDGAFSMDVFETV